MFLKEIAWPNKIQCNHFVTSQYSKAFFRSDQTYSREDAPVLLSPGSVVYDKVDNCRVSFTQKFNSNSPRGAGAGPGSHAHI